MISESAKKPPAIILTGNLLSDPAAKTAHGLIRGTDRFQIVGVIDFIHAGKDAGEVLDGKFRNIPIWATLEEATLDISTIQYCIIGVATAGGYLPENFIGIIKACISNRISIVNGLHKFLSEISDLVQLAEEFKVDLIDIRKPKPKKDLHFWSGDIFKVNIPIIAVLGMDCAVGKRTTARMIREACEKEDINAQLIYTGQTGWLQGGRFGFIFDSTLNDFISGELEYAILSCIGETHPDLIILEGQSSLRNPTGPCGSELLISGNAKHTVLVLAPKRKYYKDIDFRGELPSIQSEIELIKMYGSEVIALSLNTEQCSYEEAYAFQNKYESELKIPVLLPIQEGVHPMIPLLKHLFIL